MWKSHGLGAVTWRSPEGQEQLEERQAHSLRVGLLVRPKKNQESGVLGRSADQVSEEGMAALASGLRQDEG